MSEPSYHSRGDVTRYKPYAVPMYRSDDDSFDRRLSFPVGSQGPIPTKIQTRSSDTRRRNEKRYSSINNVPQTMSNILCSMNEKLNHNSTAMSDQRMKFVNSRGSCQRNHKRNIQNDTRY